MQLGFLFKKRKFRSRLQGISQSNLNPNIAFATVPNLMSSQYNPELNNISQENSSSNTIEKTEIRQNNTFKKKNKKFKIILLFFLLFIISFSGYRIIKSKNSKPPVLSQTTISPFKKIIPVNKKFTFPGFDNQGKEKGEIELTITSAEKNSEVIVKEQSFKAKEGKLFLIVNLELQNDSTDRLNIFPGDLIRLTAGSPDKKYAPDLHNNVVLVAPISTKIDRVGFVIDVNAKDITLLVGELEEKKTEVLLKL